MVNGETNDAGNLKIIGIAADGTVPGDNMANNPIDVEDQGNTDTYGSLMAKFYA